MTVDEATALVYQHRTENRLIADMRWKEIAAVLFDEVIRQRDHIESLQWEQYGDDL